MNGKAKKSTPTDEASSEELRRSATHAYRILLAGFPKSREERRAKIQQQVRDLGQPGGFNLGLLGRLLVGFCDFLDLLLQDDLARLEKEEAEERRLERFIVKAMYYTPPERGDEKRPGRGRAGGRRTRKSSK